MKVLISILALVSCFQSFLQAQTEPKASGSKFDAKWQAVVGEWVGEGEGAPGAGGGTSSFQFDLQQRVLIRRSRSDYPATKGRPATMDLMVIYPGTDGDQCRAMYFDNESHVIEYTAAWSAGGDVLTFTSKPSATAPQYRLVYKKLDAKNMTVSFEMAPPGQANAFKLYISGNMRRKSGG